jgi:hypothetical protein
MHALVRLVAIPFLALGCQHSATAEDAPKPGPLPPVPQPTPFTDRAALLQPIQVDSLTLTPIVAAPPPKEDLDVVTLDEAFGQKLVSIKEKEDDTVNQLTLTNNSDRPMFLLAGEVIIGGKQDRIIGQNTIIAANTTLVVPVFCVEHGRWQEGEGENGRVFQSAKALAHGRLRGKASHADQGEVWREVAQKNRERKTTNATDTYRQVANQQATGALAAQEKRVAAALAKVSPADRANMIGYVVALNGKVATVDMFNSPRLFRKLEDKLVKSYLTESVDIPAAKNIAAPTAADVKTFMADADKAKEEKSYDNQAAETTRFKGEKALKSKVLYKPAKAMGKAAEKPLYESYQAK